MQKSNQISQGLDLEYIDTPGMLLAILEKDPQMENEYLARQTLKSMDHDLNHMATELRKEIERGPEMLVTMGKLPQTPQAKKTIERAIEYARELHNDYVGTEHLLYGFLDPTRMSKTHAQNYLRKKGVTEINLDVAIRDTMFKAGRPVLGKVSIVVEVA